MWEPHALNPTLRQAPGSRHRGRSWGQELGTGAGDRSWPTRARRSAPRGDVADSGPPPTKLFSPCYGTVRIDSAPGRGPTVVCTCSLAAATDAAGEARANHGGW